jgi:hypothetical protein
MGSHEPEIAEVTAARAVAGSDSGAPGEDNILLFRAPQDAATRDPHQRAHRNARRRPKGRGKS